MPINKNAINRYKILDELLASRYHNYTLDDLTLEVNKRLADVDLEGNNEVGDFKSPFQRPLDFKSS
jgi:hypothetical protein